MTVTRWAVGQDGQWGNPAAWSAGTPTQLDDVRIDAAPLIPGLSFTVALRGDAAVHSLTQTAPFSVLAITQGTLAVTGTTTLAAGRLVLDAAGLRGGVLASNGATITIGQPSSLSGIAVRGSLAVAAAQPDRSYAQIALTGDSFAGAGGVGQGTLTLGRNILASLGATPTMDNVVVALAGATLGQQSGTFTLGSHSAITASGFAMLGTPGGALRSMGVVSASGSATRLTVQASTLANGGMLAVSNGASLYLEAGSFANAGLLSVGAGSYLRIDAPGGLSGAGTLAVAGGTVSLDTDLTTAQLAALRIGAGTLAVSGALDNAGAVLRPGAGALATAITLEGGSISGGTVVNTGAFAVGQPPLDAGGSTQGTLSGVTFDGTLDLAGAGAQLTLTNGFVGHGVDGAGDGSVTIGGDGATLCSIGNQTLDYLSIGIGDAAPSGYAGSALYAISPLSQASTLTLGAHTTVQQTGRLAQLGGVGSNSLVASFGTIIAGTPGGTLALTQLANAGLLAVANGDLASLQGVTNTGTISVSGAGLAVQERPFYADPSYFGLHNAGVLRVSNGATANLGSYGSAWTNTGTLAVSDAEVFASGTLTTAQLGTVQAGASGTLALDGVLANTGCLTLGAGGNIAVLALSGTLSGGIVRDGGSGLCIASRATLDSVCYRGALVLDQPMATLTVVNGLQLRDLSGTQAGSLTLTGPGAALVWDSAQTLGYATLDIGSDAGSAIVAGDGAAPPVRLGRLLHVRQTSIHATIGGTTGSFTSAATIDANAARGTLALGGESFLNIGTIDVGATETVSVAAGSFTNAGAILMASGMLAEAGATPMLNAASGHIAGSGKLAGPIDNEGTVEARGGVLTLLQAVSGTGMLKVDAGAELVLGSVGSGQVASFGGTGGVLALRPPQFLGAIGGFAAGDTLDLLDTVARSAAFDGNTLRITLADGSTLHLATTSHCTGSLSVSAGHQGDTLIHFTPPAWLPATHTI